MFVIIVGGGKTGSLRAGQFINAGHQIKLIENRLEIIERLKAVLPEDAIIVGDGSSPEMLEIAGIERADVLAAVTGDDEANLVSTTLARFEFDVPRTIARVNNPKNAWLFTPEMGVDVGLNQTEVLARLIAEENDRECEGAAGGGDGPAEAAPHALHILFTWRPIPSRPRG